MKCIETFIIMALKYKKSHQKCMEQMNVSVISCIFLRYFVCPVVGMINRTTYRLHGDNALRKLVVWSKLLLVFVSFQTFIFNLHFFTILILIRLLFIKNISYVFYALNKSHIGFRSNIFKIIILYFKVVYTRADGEWPVIA